MKKTILILWSLLLLTSCSDSQNNSKLADFSLESTGETRGIEQEQSKDLNNKVDKQTNEIIILKQEIKELESKNRELENYKSIHFKEMKLIEEYKNPDDSNNNIYIYTNSFNDKNIDSIKNVENCARIRFVDNHANNCFIFIGNESYKKLLFQYDYPITQAFQEKNTFSIQSTFGDGGGSVSKELKVNILDGSSQLKTWGSHDEEKIYSTNIFECLKESPELVTFIPRCFKELYPNN